MPAPDTSCATATKTHETTKARGKKQFDLARSLNRQINEFERTQGHAVVNSRPLRLGFDISSACNANCIFCLAEKGRLAKKDPDAFRPPQWLDHFEPLLPFIDLGIFSSYEALLNPQFDQFVNKMHAYHTPFQIFTNGKELTAEMSEFILRKGLHSLFCSFHSPTPQVYESIMRGLSFDETLTNLMQLKLLARRHNPAFGLTLVFCAMRRNIEQLIDYVDLAQRVGARTIQVNYLLVTNPKHGLEKESMFFNQALYDDYVLAAKVKAARLGIPLNHQPLFCTGQVASKTPCYRPWEHLNVSKEGDVTICCGGAGQLGNIFRDDFFKVWNSKPFRAFRQTVNSDNPPAQCKKCSRGKENPLDITTHITYLRSMPAQAREERIRELTALHGSKPPSA